jgi:hypothetical protein
VAAATTRARAQGLQSTDATTHAITLPASIVVGELLLVGFACDTATTTVSTSSTGWTILANVPQGTSTNHTAVVLYKIATGSDALTINTSTAEQSTHISLAITNGAAPNEADANGGSASTTAPAAITPSGGTADYLGVLFTMTDSSTAATQTFGVSSGYSNSITQNPTTTTSAATNSQERTYLASAGWTPGGVSLSTAEQWVSITVAVPFGGGGATTYTKTGAGAPRGACGGAKASVGYTAPGTVFNLANVWSLTVPTGPLADADEILPAQLPTYASRYWYLDTSNRLVATAPVQGSHTSGSLATRSELREWYQGARAAWSFATSTPRQLTVTGVFDPTSITDSKVMIVGQIHGASGTPPIYLTVDFDNPSPRLRLFENGPGLMDLLTNLTATTQITYRIYVGGGRCKIWAAVGTVANLPGVPQYDKPAATYSDGTACYLKAPCYNKSEVPDGGTGDAIATVTVLELLQDMAPGVSKTGGSAGRGACGGAKSTVTSQAASTPVFRSSSIGAVGYAQTALTIAKPVGLVAGDYLFALQACDGDAQTLVGMNAPSGFAQLTSMNGSNVSPRKTWVKLWSKIASAADAAASTFTFQDTANSDHVVVLMAIKVGTYDPVNPITFAAITTATGSSTSSHPAPSIAAGVATAMLVCAFTADTNGTQRSYTKPSAMTEAGQDAYDWVCALLCYQTLSASGATGTRTATLSTSRPYNTISLMINPAPAAVITSKSGGSAGSGAPGGPKQVTSAAKLKTGAGAVRGAPGGAKTVQHNIIVGLDTVYVGVAQLAPDFARRITLGTPLAVGVQTGTGPGTTPAHVIPLSPVTFGVAVGKTSAYSMATTPFGVAVTFPGLTVGFAGTHSGPSLRGVPPIIVSAGVRVMAQTIISKTWVHRELPVADLKISYRLSGPNMITGTIDPENRELSELLVALPPWGTWIHVEEGGDVCASGILLPGQTEADGSMTVTAAGVSSYAGRIPFVGPSYAGVNVDPIDVVRKLWEHIQGFPRGDLGVTVAGASGVLIGLPPTFPTTAPQLTGKPKAAQLISARLKGTDPINGDWSWTADPPEVDQYHQELMDAFLAQGGLGQGRALQEAFLDKIVKAAQDVAMTDIFNAEGPFFIKADELPAIGRIIDQLGNDCPFDYVEECGYSDPTVKNIVWHRIRCQSPQIGDRLSLNLTMGENITEVGAFEEPDDAYCDSAYVKGAGEGPDSIIGYSGTTVADRLRMPTVVTDKTLMTAKAAVSRAATEVAARLAAIEELEQIAVNVRHPNSPWGTFRVGDEILPRVRLPYIGVFAQWHRITQIEYQPEAGIAVLTLTRRAGFGK